MRNQAEPSKEGIISLVVMMILIILVVALSGPIYRMLSGEGKGTEYTSAQEGYGGEVLVTLKVRDGKVYSLMAEGTLETPGIGGKAITHYNETTFADLSDAYIDEVSTKLDAVSGATYTSGAVAAGYQAVIEEAQEDLRKNSQ